MMTRGQLSADGRITLFEIRFVCLRGYYTELFPHIS